MAHNAVGLGWDDTVAVATDMVGNHRTAVKDGANPKPYTFVGFDSWFVVNVMQLLVD